MSGAKAVLDKRELECSVCLERFKEPKTLQCLHSYCLWCLETLMETHGKISCPKCCQTYDDLKKEDLKNLTSNKMINDLVTYVEKIESEKVSECSNCHNIPKYFCMDYQLYLCGECIKQHKLIPILKDHSLYTLDKTDEQRNEKNCQTHYDYLVEFFCRTCNKIGCEKCQHVLHCYKNKHDVIPMETAVVEFNQNVAEISRTIDAIKDKLKRTLDISNKDRSNFESQLKLCRTAIEIQEKQIIKMVQEKAKKLLADLDEIYKEKKEVVDSQVKNIDSKLIQVDKVSISVNTMMNKPEETEALRSHEAIINALKDEVLGDEFDKSFSKRNITPTFISHTHLYDVINTDGIGKITNADCVYKIAKDDESITVTKRQPFVVKVSKPAESEVYQLAATLIHISGKESATEVEDHKNGEYRIKGACKLEGDWKMVITAGAAHINGSPVNIKVEKLGLVQTIDNIATLKENNKEHKVADVMLDADGCLLVSSLSKDVFKFNQSGLFVDRIQIPEDVQVFRMYRMDDGCMVYSDNMQKCVVMCDKNLNEICSFGKGILQCQRGLTVRKETRIMYVADRDAHCVLKFNVADGRLLGKIGSEGSEEGQMKEPQDVTVTKDGHLIVADFDNNRIQMFDANDNFIRIIIKYGKDGGRVFGPCCLITDMDENLIISSNHKLQLFDKNGVFIKRIDNKDDGLNVPYGIAVISQRPRRVAVTNHKANNVKIFNY